MLCCECKLLENTHSLHDTLSKRKKDTFNVYTHKLSRNAPESSQNDVLKQQKGKHLIFLRHGLSSHLGPNSLPARWGPSSLLLQTPECPTFGMRRHPGDKAGQEQSSRGLLFLRPHKPATAWLTGGRSQAPESLNSHLERRHSPQHGTEAKSAAWRFSPVAALIRLFFITL